MDGTYQMLHDIIDFHNDRMRNLRRYYPFFCLQNTAFHLFKEGKYAFLDMGYITLAVLRFFIEENQFNDRSVTYPEITDFISGILTRDFDLTLPPEEEKELTDYIFDKLKNDGKPFVMEYFDPVKKTNASVRMKLIDATLSGNAILYSVTADAIEFYLDTKEIRDESKINIQQILLEKMIHTKNFKGGIDVIRRINSEVNRLRLQKREVLALLGSNVFDGVKALEEFNQTGMRWFSEEQKLFSHNMELMERARAKAEETAEGAKDMESLRGIYQLETELKKAMANHGELLADCMDLQVRADEMIHKYKYSRLRGAFDFRGFVAAAEEAQDVTMLAHLVEPLLAPKLQKQFSLLQTDELLAIPPEAGETAETVEEAKEEMYRFDDEIEEERISGNYAAIVKTLLDELLAAERVSLSALNRKLELKFFDGIFKNSDYYSFLVHICQKKDYDLDRIKTKQDTFFEGILAKLLSEPGMKKYDGLKFCLVMKPEAEELVHKIAGLERDATFVTTEIVFERMTEEKATELLAALLVGEPVEAKNGKNTGLYEAYHESGEVSDALELMLKKLNLRVYEYNYGLYVAVGEKNRVFGYSNEDLKRMMGLRLNKELYLCYYLIYQAAALFYQDSATYNYREYIKLEDLLEAVNHGLSGMVSELHRFANETPEETSFKALAISWDELPVIANEDTQGVRAGRGSKSGFVKLVFNFMVSQGLFTEVGERYYPTNRMHALIRRYFEEEKGRLYELQLRSSKGGEDGAAY